MQQLQGWYKSATSHATENRQGANDGERPSRPVRSIERKKKGRRVEPKLRIAILAPVGRPVPATGYGPVELVIDNLVRELHTAGHEVVLFAADDSTSPVPRHVGLGRANIELVESRAGELAYVMQAYKHLSNFDIIHDHTLIGPALAIGKPEFTVVTTNHGSWDNELTPVFRELAEHIPITCVSRNQAAAAPVQIAGVVHHGIDAGAIPLGHGDGGYLVFIGRMSEHKGPHIAARLAHEMGFHLIIAGSYTKKIEQDFFDAKVRPLLGGSVEYVGEVFGDEKFRLLGGALGLLNPLQWEEPFGLVMIEALATGTPVIALRRGSVPEIVEHGINGFVCDNENELRAAIGQVALLSRADCRTRAETWFSCKRMADGYLKLYRRVLEDKRRAETADVIDLTASEYGVGAATVALDGA